MTDALRTLLVFAHECAPYHRPQSTIGAQRPAQFAKHLPEFGWRAVVVCCDRDRRRRGSLEGLAEQIRAAIRTADPQRSLILPTPSLPWDGWLDRLWHATAPADGRAGRVRDLLRRPLTVAKFLTGDYSQSWQPCAWVAAQVVAEETPVAACMAEHTPDAGLFLARRFARRFGVPWVADFRDPILQPLRPMARKLYAPVARRLLATAAATINVTPALARADGALFKRPSHCIPNGFDPDEFRHLPEARRNGCLLIAYAGNILRNQRLEPFLQGLALARQALGQRAAGKLRFWYRGNAREQVVRLARQHGVVDLIDTAGRLDRSEVLRLLGKADILLLLSIASFPPEDALYFAAGICPGKTFEYFGVRRPILCVPGDGGLLDELLRETNTGVTARTPQAVADFLVYAFGEWEQGRPVPYRPNESAVARYHRRGQAARLAAVLDEVVGPAEPGNGSPPGRLTAGPVAEDCR
jgi:glycosyltransferase involved in cell wall biosynthesis